MLFIVSKQCACSRRVHIEGHTNGNKTSRTKDNSDQDNLDHLMDNSDHFLRTTRTTFLGQLGPIFSVRSDHFLGQLGPLCKDNSDHFLKTTQTSFTGQFRPLLSVKSDSFLATFRSILITL